MFGRNAIHSAVLLLSIATGGLLGAQQPSNREAAVAIDRVPIPQHEEADVERVAAGLRRPWSIAFLPNGDFLVTEKHHGLRLIRPRAATSAPVPGGPPDLYASSDSGLLDVVLDPDFASNRFVYVAYAQGDERANRTAIWKARFAGDRLAGGRVLFRVATDKAGSGHPGGRLLFLPDRTLLLTVGDGFDYRDKAQDMGSHLGKVLRLTREGSAPRDNPFIGRPGVLPEIWSSGHRNVQGLALDSATGTIWSHEHGPRGGDEINQLKAGANYGWPNLTHGIDYDGKIISSRTFAPGFEPSRFYWAPSIAPSGLAIYRGERFPAWDGKFFVGGLVSRSIVRLSIGRDSGLFVEEQRMLGSLRERIRDLRVGPDGLLYVLTDSEDGQLWRLVPRPSNAGPGSEKGKSD